MNACSIDWALWPDWISAAASVGTLGVAVWALRAWREQLRGGSRYAVAQEVATAARSLKYAFYGVRSPLIEAWEFPEAYWSGGPGRTRSNTEEADGYWHVYRRRYQELWPSIKVVADLRAKAAAVLGEDCAKDLEDLAKKARELDFFFQQDVEQRRAGPEGVRQWSDQAYVQRVKASVIVGDKPDDPYSVEFEAILGRTLGRLRPYLLEGRANR